MAAKKKKNKVNVEVLYEQDEVLIALKERYFRLLKKEDIGKTPQLTTVIDKLEQTISHRMEELRNE